MPPPADLAELFAKIYRPGRPAFLLDCPAPGRGSRWAYMGVPSGKPLMLKAAGAGALANLRKLFSGCKSRGGHSVLNAACRRVRSCGFDDIPGSFKGGWVGFLSYECNRLFERLPKPRGGGGTGLPDIALMECREWVAFDCVDRRAWHVNLDDGCVEQVKISDKAGFLDDYLEKFRCICRCRLNHGQSKFHAGRITSDTGSSGFQAGVRRVKEYIRAGDVFQVNLAHRLSGRFRGPAFEFYRRLRKLNPSPFACYMDFGKFQIASCSPELLVSVSGDRIETRPIAGTRPRGSTPGHDRRLSAELLLDPKERAEHIMLVDLERNDLGRICRHGTVRVSQRMALERYSHVTHIVSHVCGRLKDSAGPVDVLRAVFPGGTITGCPKVRCMEIIRELEKHRRGPYCGSAGWIGYDGSMVLNILIRTALFESGRVHVWAGAGIVADSVPAREYRETMHKAAALLEALKDQ